MSKLAILKDIILEILADGKEHSASELREEVQNRGVFLKEGSSAFRTAMYQLRNSELNIESKERGVYCLVKEKEELQLKGFRLLKPNKKISKRCVYIHQDGKIILNGGLNAEIESREIEIRIAEGGEKIALIMDGRDCHRFTKSGHTKNPEILKIYGKKKMNFPIGYEMEKKEGFWIGNLRKEKLK